MIKNMPWSSCKIPDILARFYLKLEFSLKILEKKKNEYSMSWNSVQWELSCSRRTDTTKLIAAFAIWLPRLEMLVMWDLVV